MSKWRENKHDHKGKRDKERTEYDASPWHEWPRGLPNRAGGMGI